MKNLDKLSKGERFIFEWQYRIAGSFGKALAEAMALADDSNLEKFRKGFPEEVEALLKYRNEKGWWGKVYEKTLY